MLAVAKTITLLCGMIPNWAPKTTCTEYIYTCILNGSLIEGNEELTLLCINQYAILNNSWKPEK